MAKDSTYTRRINLFINGKEVKNDVKSIKSEMQKLINAQAKMTIGSDEYVQQGKQIKVLNGILKKHRSDLNQTAKSWGGMSSAVDGFNKYFGVITAGIASLTGIVFSFRKAADASNLFEERVDNLGALTRLKGKDLEWLGEIAKQSSVKITNSGVRIKQSATEIVDAYTMIGSQRPELLKNKKALAEITEEAIILSEAAKGKLEPAAGALTNTLNQFNLKATESRRVINVLAAGSQAGAANIPYISQAIEKVGTTANIMGIPVERMVGTIEAAAPKFKEASVAGNSLDKVLMKMKAKQIGYKNGVFDMNAALLELEARFKKGQTAEEIFGVEHAKMAEVLVQARGEVEYFTEAVTGSNVAIEQASQNTDNNAAKLAQAKNSVTLLAIEFGEKLSAALTSSVTSFGKFLRVSMATYEFLKENKGLIISAGVAVATYTILTKAQTVATLAYEKATILATRATIAFKSANTGNLAALIVTALTTAVALMVSFGKETSKTAKYISDFTSKVATEKSQMYGLFDLLKKTKEGTSARKEAIKKINAQYKDYLPNMLSEKSSLKEIEEAQGAVNKALLVNIAVKSKQLEMEKVVSSSIKAQQAIVGDIINDVREKQGSATAGIAQAAVMDVIDAFAKAETTLERQNIAGEFAKTFGRVSKDSFEGFAENYNQFTRILNLQIREANNVKSLTSFFDSYIDKLKEYIVVKEEQEDVDEEMVEPIVNVSPKKDNDAKKLEEARSKLQVELDAIWDKLNLRDLTDYERNKNIIIGKYTDLSSTISDLWATEPKKKADLDGQVEQMMSNELHKLEEEEGQKRLQAKADLESKLLDMTGGMREREIASIRKHYEKIINEVEAFNDEMIRNEQTNLIDTTDLYKQMIDELDSLNEFRYADEADIFGMTPEDWEELMTHFDKTMVYINQIGQLWGAMNTLANQKDKEALQNYEKGVNRKKELLDKQLGAGEISQEKYTAKVAQLDSKLDKKKAELARKQAEREKAIAIFQAVVSTAAGIAEALPVIPLAILAGVIGAAQIAAIASVPLPAYEQGGYHGFTQGDGIYASESGQPFRAGEGNKTEWIGNNKMISDPYTGPIISTLEQVQRGKLSPAVFAREPAFESMTEVPKFAQGGYSNSQAALSFTSPKSDDTLMKELIMEMRNLKEENRQMNAFMSDPANRQATISNDLLQKQATENVELQKIGRIE